MPQPPPTDRCDQLAALRTLADEGHATLTDAVCPDTHEPIWRTLRRRRAGERR